MISEINMYELYRKVKKVISELENQCDIDEKKGRRNDYAYKYDLYLQFVELKQAFYNENIKDNHLVEKYNELIEQCDL